VPLITRIFPTPAQELPLEGAYLAHRLRDRRVAPEGVFVYANFVASLDGRIAIPHPSRPGLAVPKSTANDRDWRLFQELAAQADLILTTGRYLRDWAEGRAQEILRVDDPRFADLMQWRREQGLPPQPDLAIISGSLDFPIPGALAAGGRKAVVFTSGEAAPARVKEIEAEGIPVIAAGEREVEGPRLIAAARERGWRTVYSAAGPKVLHLLLSGGVLDRLYLTLANRLLGGKPYATVVEGELLEPPADMRLNTAYFDPHGLKGLGQLFLSYDRVTGSP
jgi:riboflavin biosynthesis pyrimidine reductase